MVLSTCSPYFRSLFATVPQHLHPVVFLKDVEVRIMELLLRYMYSGQVSVVSDRLVPLVQAAKSLCIKGLLDVPVPSTTAAASEAGGSSTPAAPTAAKPTPVNSRLSQQPQSQQQSVSVPVKKLRMIKPKVESSGSQGRRGGGGVSKDSLLEPVSGVEFCSETVVKPVTARHSPVEEPPVFPVISVDDDTRHELAQCYI
jgi:hypothetical protein